MPTQHLFISWAPYATDPGTLERRAARPGHRAVLEPLIASGIVKLAGPLWNTEADLSWPYVEHEKFGSVIVYQGESLESVRRIIETEPFWIEGVWDRERLQLHPMVNLAYLTRKYNAPGIAVRDARVRYARHPTFDQSYVLTSHLCHEQSRILQVQR
ncbi:uncharacterized protein C8Q71DRAFT_860137 [Rhodofomes roseus]|uniref:YCII-related domain-containing protein n=1 Tax=Rhodofomes roseus TaxID=34475 RepID=A0ABQ8KAG1_9APHY|nr:uncharacterized protein C8Q71DRAFT_860137 [Rhodofomes roseus]KAH9833870.1 hypothetical protein C8Q71DRAFT_860137 [Rhodofomes roseus]